MLDSAYISQVFPLGPADAIEATESWYRQLAFAPGGRRLVGGHRLFLRPSFEPTDFDPLLLRRLRGTLCVGWWWPVRVELELARYSRSASEIALRPSTLRWPVATERYAEDAARAVEEVLATITIGVDALAEPSVEPRGNERQMCRSRPKSRSPMVSPIASSDTDPPSIQRLTDKTLSGRRQRRGDLLVTGLADGLHVRRSLVGEEESGHSPHETV